MAWIHKISNECLNDALDAGLSQSEIARMCNCSRQAIHCRINYKPRPKITIKYNVIRELHKLGFTSKQIQIAMKYKHIDSVYKALKKLNLKPNKERR